ncbi:MAG: hypothetical protein A2539_03475 [Elusimicrobia bacterium RIFOXYD2_FULL_34_15]|nr:MAG: hypothetical protein A2539_03475 [Elusimicrobia bacterium RIFOXYD2_FULL_34_15]
MGKNRKLIQKIRNSKYPEFYKKVWIECLKIPKGNTISYSELAKRIKNPKSARAVGNALGKNPFAPYVPCHRVIKKNRQLGGYSGGLNKKINLLKNEGFKII